MKPFLRLAIMIMVLMCLSQNFLGQPPSSAEKIEYCQIFEKGVFRDRKVTTFATLYIPPYGQGFDYLYSASCNNKDYVATVDYSTTDYVELLLKQKLTMEKKYPSGNFLLRVKVTGSMTVEQFPAFGPLGSMTRAELKVSHFESVKSVEKGYQQLDAVSPAPILDMGEALVSANADLIPVLFGVQKPLGRHLKMLENLNLNLHDGDGLNTNLKGSDFFLHFEIDPKPTETRMTIKEVIQRSDGWVVKGELTIGKTHQQPIHFDGYWIDDGGASFFLTKITFTPFPFRIKR